MLETKEKLHLRNVCCIGAGYVGGPSGAIVASKAPHLTVTIVDTDEARIAAWNSAMLPVHESHLEAIVKTARDGIPGVRAPNLRFSTDVDRAIRDADLIFLSVNTPTKRTGLGAGRASNLGWVEAATRRIAKVAEHDAIVVEKSTVPCGTAAAMRKILLATARPGINLEVLSNPEFLAEGTAVENLINPDRVLIGCRDHKNGYEAATLLAEVYMNWIPVERIITMNLWSSELSKLACNAMLAQRISSINALSAICEGTSADIDDISLVCGSDQRIGSGMLKASVGFGGSCFRKDLLNLVYISESLGLFEVANYWKAVIEINEYQKARFTSRIVRTMHGNLHDKKIAILGFAYKKNTGDTRDTAAITIVDNLLAENAFVAIFDPQVQSQTILDDLQVNSSTRDRIRICSSPYQACQNAHAVVILTDWDMFRTHAVEAKTKSIRSLPSSLQPRTNETRRETFCANIVTHETRDERFPSSTILNQNLTISHNRVISQDPTPKSTHIQSESDKVQTHARLDWQKIAQIMERPRFVFDGRNIVDAYTLQEYGFQVESIGKQSFGSAGDCGVQAMNEFALTG